MDNLTIAGSGNSTSVTSSVPSTLDDNGELFVFEDYTQRLIIGSVLSVVIVVGIIGNGHVILAVLLSRKLRSPTNWFVVNLGSADLITCLFLPFNVVAMVSKDGWPIANWTCAMTGAVTLTCLGASIITLALVAYNRWTLLTKSRAKFDRLYTRRNIFLMVAFSWLYPFLLVVIPHFAGLGQLGYSHNYKICQQDTTLPTSDYYSLIAGACVIIPVFIAIVVIYALIFRFVKKHNRTMQNSRKGSNGLKRHNGTIENSVKPRDSNGDKDNNAMMHESIRNSVGIAEEDKDQRTSRNTYNSPTTSLKRKQNGNADLCVSTSSSINVETHPSAPHQCSRAHSRPTTIDTRGHDNPVVVVDEDGDLPPARNSYCDIQNETREPDVDCGVVNELHPGKDRDHTNSDRELIHGEDGDTELIQNKRIVSTENLNFTYNTDDEFEQRKKATLSEVSSANKPHIKTSEPDSGCDINELHTDDSLNQTDRSISHSEIDIVFNHQHRNMRSAAANISTENNTDIEMTQLKSAISTEISTSNTSNPKTSGRSQQHRKVSRQNINVTKRLSLVVVVFFICYIPFGVCVLVPNSDPAVPWTTLLLMINSCINPLVYAWTMPVFREVMGCIIRCRYRDIPEPVGFIRSCRR